MSSSYFLIYYILLQAQSDLILGVVGPNSIKMKNMSQVSDNHIYKPPLPPLRTPCLSSDVEKSKKENSRSLVAVTSSMQGVLEPRGIPSKNPSSTSIPIFSSPHGGYFCTRPPTIPNAQSNLDLVRSPAFSLGTKTVYSCLNGYRKKSGAEELKCVLPGNSTSAKWEESTLICEAINCYDPGFVEHSRRIGHYFRYKSNLTYICDPGYKPRGAPFIICGSNGRWNRNKPICVLSTCPRLSPPNSDFTSYHYDDNTLRVNTTVKVICGKGFHIKNSISGHATCVWDTIGARWSNSLSNCVQTFCPRPYKPHNGLRIVPKKKKYSIDGHIIMICHTNSKTSARCLSNGTWSRAIPYCPVPKKDRMCPPLHKLEHGILNCTLDNIKPGTLVAFKCDPKYDILGPDWIFCQFDGTWTSKMPICVLNDKYESKRGTGPHRITLVLISIILTIFLICFLFFILICRWRQRQSQRKRWQRYFGNYSYRQSKTNIYHNQEMKLFKDTKTVPAVPVTDL